MDEGAHPLLTVGHGTLPAEALVRLLEAAGVALVVDVRAFPGSRRHPHVAREELARRLPAAGIGYRWEPRLGGRRRALPDSSNVALRTPAFRAYADHMAGPEFAAGLDALLADAAAQPSAAMCSESLWWRCHRRLVADAAVLIRGRAVAHVLHDGRVVPHEVTAGARVADGGDHVIYDVGGQASLPLPP